MSSLRVSQTKARLRAMFEADLDLSDINSNDKDRDVKILSRCLAALAVYLSAGCSQSEAASAVWDGSDDNGIDAAYFDAPSSTVIFVQSKFLQKGAGEPEANEVGAFTKGVRAAIEGEQDDFHERLHGRLSEIMWRLQTPGTLVKLVVASTGASSLSKHATSVLSVILDDLNGDSPEPMASVEIMGLAEFYSGLTNDLGSGNVTLDGTLLDWTYVPAPIPAYFGIIDGLTLKGWWAKHGRSLLSSNIRHYLGTTDVNNQIRQTALDQPQNFWYFNNGITLVCDEAIKAPAAASSRSAGVFSLRGASLVNGAQTVSSLGGGDNDSALGEVRVPIRVILLKGAPAGFGSDVTRTNNLQNRIEPRDFVAQDPEQHRLRREMAIEGVDYQYVRSEESTPTATSCDLIEATTALACASGDAQLAVQLKTGIGRFFADLSKPPYKAIFNPSLAGARAFNTVLVQRCIDDWLERTKKATSKKSGPAWGILVHGNRIVSAAVFAHFGTAALLQPIDQFRSNLKTSEIDAIAQVMHIRLVDAVSEHYPGKFLATLFKNPTMSKKLFDIAKS